MWEITHPSQIKITKFFNEILGAKLANLNWSLGASTSNRVFLKIWKDCINKNSVKIYWKDNTLDRKGRNERLKHLNEIRDGAKCFGVLCEMEENPNSGKRKIKQFEGKRLLRLDNFDDLSKKGNVVTAEILGWFPVTKLKAVSNNRVGLQNQNSATDDLPSAPSGSKVPGRIPTAGSRYQRDEKVRQFIIEQADGACEYCRELGFLLPDGSHYLEAHHIIALADQGPDTIDNVIALCPSDHREAHYGAKAVRMENEMIEIIKTRNPPRRDGHKSPE